LTICFSASEDKLILEWDLGTGKVINTFAHHSRAVRCIQKYNGVLISGGDDKKLVFHDLKTNVKTDYQSENYILALGATSLGVVHNMNTGLVFRTKKSKNSVLYSLDGPPSASKRDNWILSIDVDKQERKVVASSTDGNIMLWNFMILPKPAKKGK